MPPSSVRLAPEGVSDEVEKYGKESNWRPVVRTLGQTTEFPYSEKLRTDAVGAGKASIVGSSLRTSERGLLLMRLPSMKFPYDPPGRATWHHALHTRALRLGQRKAKIYQPYDLYSLILQPRLATRDRNKETPLHLACRSASPSCETLYQRGTE